MNLIMKKSLLLVAIAFIFVVSAQAQWRFGVKGGANVSGFFTESTVMTQQTPQVNFQLGGLAQINFWILTFQPELLYSQRSFRVEDAIDSYFLSQYAHLTTSHPTLDMTTRHLELPLNILYKQKIGSLKLIAEIGPKVTFNLGGTFNGEADLYKSYADAYPFHWIDYGAGAGLGVEYKNFVLGTRWDWFLGRMGKPVIDESYGPSNTNIFNQMKYLNFNLTLTRLF